MTPPNVCPVFFFYPAHSHRLWNNLLSTGALLSVDSFHLTRCGIGPSSHPRTPTVVLINEVSNSGVRYILRISNTPMDSVFPLASSGFLLTGVYTTCITLTFGVPTPDPFTVRPSSFIHTVLSLSMGIL